MGYNTSAIDNVTSLDQFLGAINTAANGLPGIVVLIILWIGTFVYATGRNLDPGETVLASSFLTLLVAGLMFFIGMVGLYVVILLIVMFFGSVVYLMFK